MKKLFDKVGGKKKEKDSLVGKVVLVGQYSVKVEAIVGEGGFATIYRCVDMKSGVMFALKHMRLAADTDAIKEVQQEAKTMARLKGHPNVLRLHAVAFAGPPSCETDGFMLLDFCPLTLLEVLQRANFALDDFLVYEVFQDVARAVAHMHKCTPPLAHRDLKAENVLKNGEGRWVICDFGSSTSRAQVYDTPAEISAEEDNIRRTTTPAYRAPEMWDLYARQRIDTAVDVWALGVLLYVLAFGKLPFQGDSKLSILYGKYDMPPGRPPAMRSLVQDMLQVNPVDRPDIFQVLSKMDALRAVLVAEAGGSVELPPPAPLPPPPAPVVAQQHPQPHAAPGAPPAAHYSAPHPHGEQGQSPGYPYPSPYPQSQSQAPQPAFYPAGPGPGQPVWPAGPPGPYGAAQQLVHPPAPAGGMDAQPPQPHQHPQPHMHQQQPQTHPLPPHARPQGMPPPLGYPPPQRLSLQQLQPYAHPQHPHPHPQHHGQQLVGGPEGASGTPDPHPYAQPGQGPGPAPGVPPGLPRPYGASPSQRLLSFQPDWAAAPTSQQQAPQGAAAPPPDLLDEPFPDRLAPAFGAAAAQAATFHAPGREPRTHPPDEAGPGSGPGGGSGAAFHGPGQTHPHAAHHRRTGSGQHPRSAPASAHLLQQGGFGFGDDDADWGEQPAFTAAASAGAELPSADHWRVPLQQQQQQTDLLSMDSLPTPTGTPTPSTSVLRSLHSVAPAAHSTAHADSRAGSSPRMAAQPPSSALAAAHAAAPSPAPTPAAMPDPSAPGPARALAAPAAQPALNGSGALVEHPSLLRAAGNEAAAPEEEDADAEGLRAQVQRLSAANATLEDRVRQLEGLVASQSELLARVATELHALQHHCPSPHHQQQQDYQSLAAEPMTGPEQPVSGAGATYGSGEGSCGEESAPQAALASAALSADNDERPVLAGGAASGGGSGGVLASNFWQGAVFVEQQQQQHSAAAIYPTVRYADLG